MKASDFDFSGKKVRYQGKVLDKFDLAQRGHEFLISIGKGYYNRFHMPHICPEHFTYKELRSMLLEDCLPF